jgi:hypothetical protein
MVEDRKYIEMEITNSLGEICDQKYDIIKKLLDKNITLVEAFKQAHIELAKDERYQRNHEYYIKNKAKLLDHQKQYNKDHKEQVNARFRQYRSKNKEEINKAKREHYKVNKESILAKAKERRDRIKADKQQLDNTMITTEELANIIKSLQLHNISIAQ